MLAKAPEATGFAGPLGAPPSKGVARSAAGGASSLKQGLSLRVSQHLALTPQLQQSIRLLQLSTLEMAQEVEQMLDENPFLERSEDIAEREAFGLEQTDTPVSAGEQIAEAAQPAADAPRRPNSMARSQTRASSTTSDSGPGDEMESRLDGATPVEESWEGDGTVEMAPDDSEWGGDAPARNNSSGGDDDETASAADLARAPVSLQDHLHDQARTLRLNDHDRAALYFLIESLNDDGYLDGTPDRAGAGAGGACPPARCPMPSPASRSPKRPRPSCAWRWAGCRPWSPPVWARATWPSACACRSRSCATAPRPARRSPSVGQSLELMAKRDVKRLCALTGTDDDTVRAALALIARLEPKPGRRFVDVERNVVVPDVLVTRAGRGFKVSLNPDVMPRLRVHDIYANAMRGNRGGRDGTAAKPATPPCSSACRKRAGSSRTSSSASTPSCA